MRAEEPEPSAQSWPRIYRPSLGWRLVLGLGGAGLLALGVGTSVIVPESTATAPWLVVAMGVALAALGIGAIVSTFRDRIVLFHDAIEVRHFPSRARVARREDIRGRRIIATHPLRTLVLELHAGPKLQTTLTWPRDAVLDAWFESLPDLDAEDLARSEAELLASSALGPSDLERARAIAAARRVARALNVTAVATAMWGMFYPRPYPVVVAALALLPLVALGVALTGRGLYAIDERRNEVRPNVAFAVMMPGFALALRAMLDVRMVDPLMLAAPVAVLAVVLGTVAALVDSGARSRWGTGILMTFLFACYAGGALVEANTLFDRGERETFRAEVLAKHVTTGRDGGTYVRLPAWGPVLEGDHRVSGALYREVEVGDVVCVELRHGALGARWYMLGECR